MPKFHDLSVVVDKINGSNGKDTFLAPLAFDGGEHSPTLTSADRLDGRGGRDMIEATLDGDLIKAGMKNIELGRFTDAKPSEMMLDLARARQMTALEFIDFKSFLAVSHATLVSSASFTNYGDSRFASLEGIDTKRVKVENLTFTGCTSMALYIETLGSKPLARLDVTLDRSDIALFDDIAARMIAIHSIGEQNNLLTLLAQSTFNHTAKLTIGGAANLKVAGTLELKNLTVLDASKASGDIEMTFNGPQLTLLKGSSGDDIIHLGDIGGTKAHRAQILLGDGSDVIYLDGSTLDGRYQAISGGSGQNVVQIEGGIEYSAGLFRDFGRIYITNADGYYDLEGSGADDIRLFGTSDDVTLDHVQSGTFIQLAANQEVPFQVNVDGALSSMDDVLYLTMTGPSIIGDGNHGFSSPGLSQLAVYSYTGDCTFMLENVGSESDPLRLTIGGTSDIAVAAAIGSVNYISTIAITNTAGADITGLEFSELAFVASGATITGGAGDDILVGGFGNDTINTGGGNNKVYGSNGIDHINMMLNGGLDVLVFDQQTDSAFGSGDIVTNFSQVDTIDINDLVSGVNFVGNVTSQASGLALLSGAQSRAFFNTATQTLHVDINHDGQLDAAHDLSVTLTGLSSFNSFNVIG